MIKALYLLDAHWQRRVYPESFDAELASTVRFVAPPQTAAAVRARWDLVQDVEVIFTGWGMARVDAEFLSHAPRLRAIFHAAGSIRYFATPELWRRGIAVATAHEINAIPVAEYTLAVILFGLRHGWQHAAAARTRGTLDPDKSLPGTNGSTVALISLGAVGRLVRERLRPFDVRVIAFDPFCPAEAARALDVELVSLEECFRRGDVVSLHAPLLPETQGMIRGEHFARMKPRATFINTARGAVVRELEMIEALTRRPDLHAVLDVTDPEPPIPGSPLYQLPNVTLTPHLAGTCEAEASRLGRTMIEEFHRWRRSEPLRHDVTEAQAARLA